MDTIAYGPAKDSYFAIDNVNGNSVDLTAYITNVSFDVDGNLIDVTTMSDNWHEKIRGQADATLSIEGIFDPFPGTVLQHLGTASSSSTWVYGPQGTVAAKLKYTGECFLTSYSYPAGIDEAVTFSAEFQNTGTVTFTTF